MVCRINLVLFCKHTDALEEYRIVRKLERRMRRSESTRCVEDVIHLVVSHVGGWRNFQAINSHPSVVIELAQLFVLVDRYTEPPLPQVFARFPLCRLLLRCLLLPTSTTTLSTFASCTFPALA